jgi:hypothetical protein
MSAILTSLLAGAGKQLLQNVFDGDGPARAQPANRAEQLGQFERRLSHEMNPEKAQLTRFLESEGVRDVQSLDLLEGRLEEVLFSDPELQGFVEKAGGASASFELEQRGDSMVLRDAFGGEQWIGKGSRVYETAMRLDQVQSLKENAAAYPGFDLRRCIELHFSA